MSNQKHTDLSNNQTIREAIRKIAWRGLINSNTGAVHGTGKITGYVAKIHTEEDDELAGTIDVQEFIQSSMDENNDLQIGYHEGVLLSAIQDGSKGMVIVPKMYSEVIVSQDPDTGAEYVSMFSHVDLIQLDSHETITIGVKEREEFDDSDENSPDIDDLEETGVLTRTEYTKDTIKTEVHKAKDSHITTQEMTGEHVVINVDDEQTSVSLDKDKIQMKRDSAETTMAKDKTEVKVGGSSVVVKDGTVYLGSESGTDDAVLGKELASILSDLVQYISQIMTPTMMGPQAPVNMASFIALKAKIDAFKSSDSGFLTKKVLVQK